MSRMSTVSLIIDNLLSITAPEELAEIAAGNLSYALSGDLRSECAREQLPYDTVRNMLVQECQERVANPY